MSELPVCFDARVCPQEGCKCVLKENQDVVESLIWFHHPDFHEHERVK